MDSAPNKSAARKTEPGSGGPEHVGAVLPSQNVLITFQKRDQVKIKTYIPPEEKDHI